MVRTYFSIAMLIMLCVAPFSWGQDQAAAAPDAAAGAAVSQETPSADAAGGVAAATDAQSGLPAPTQQTTTPAGEGGATSSVDSALSTANQAFLALQQRQFPMALAQYKSAAASNPEYQKMVNFTQAVIDRINEMMDDQMQLYSKTMATNFRMEDLTRDEVNKMLAVAMKQQKAGQQLGEVALIAEIPIVELGLDFQGADQVTLGEYLGWGASPALPTKKYGNVPAADLIDREMIYAKMEILQQQRQERLTRVQDYRRRRLERQGGGLSGSVGSGGGGMGGMMGRRHGRHGRWLWRHGRRHGRFLSYCSFKTK